MNLSLVENLMKQFIELDSIWFIEMRFFAQVIVKQETTKMESSKQIIDIGVIG